MLKITESHAISRSEVNNNYFVKKDNLIIASFKCIEDANQFCFLKNLSDKNSLKECYLTENNLDCSCYPSDKNENFINWIIKKILNT